MTPLFPPLCDTCQHLKKDDWTCLAFPKGIPEEVITSAVDHRESIDGDRGVTYSPSRSMTIDPILATRIIMGEEKD